MLCNNIKKLFPQPIANIIKNHICFKFDKVFKTDTARSSLFKNTFLYTEQKRLKYIFVELIENTNETKIIKYVQPPQKNINEIKIHKKKYYKLIVEFLIFNYYSNSNPYKIVLAEFSKKMEQFIYKVLKKTFKPKFGLYKKVFKIKN
jgi:hypothetical protein